MELNFDYLPYFYALIIVAGTILLAFLFRRIFDRIILKSTRILRNDPTKYQFLRHTISALIYLIGFGIAIFQVESLKALAGSMLAGAGIVAVAVGFASQQALSNIVSGIFIILFKPYRINDRVVIKDTLQGTVEDITLRHTVIRDFFNRRIVIPNSVINNEVIINADLEDERICRYINMGISYDSDIAKARAIMREEVLNHPLRIDQRTSEQIENGAEEVPVRVVSLGDSSVNLRAWAWAANQADAFVMECDLLEIIKNRFDAEGIEIPFPYRTVVMKGAGEPEA